MNTKIFFMTFGIGIFTASESYRILAIFPLNIKSHNIFFEALLLALGNRGHQIDLITHFPLKNPPKNYNTILNLNGTLKSLVNNITYEYAMQVGDDYVYHISTTFGNEVCKMMAFPEMQNLAKYPPKDPPYDVLMVENLALNCFMGYGRLLNIPIIGVHSTAEYPWITDIVGNCDNLAITPNLLTEYTGVMSFWERLHNVYVYYNNLRKYYALTEESQTMSMRTYLDRTLPSIRVVERDFALTFLNSHHVIFGVKALASSLIQIAGIHIEQDTAKFSPRLKKWMDESTAGVVYFTLGSQILIETLPTSIIATLFSVFAKISPIRILMKIADSKKLPFSPSGNVLMSSWLPQIPILGHKNLKVFMTHGGLLGSQEALYFGVPMIGLPIYADQSRIVGIFVEKNMSIKVDINQLTEESLTDALNNVLYDPTYRQYAKYYSKLFRDQPINATDTAIYWTEFVVRNGPDVLKSPAIEFSWWQLALLDIYGFFLVCILFVIFTLFYIIRSIHRRLRNEKAISKEKDKKEN